MLLPAEIYGFSSPVMLSFCSDPVPPNTRRMPAKVFPPSFGIESIRTPPSAFSADCDPAS